MVSIQKNNILKEIIKTKTKTTFSNHFVILQKYVKKNVKPPKSQSSKAKLI